MLKLQCTKKEEKEFNILIKYFKDYFKKETGFSFPSGLILLMAIGNWRMERKRK